MGADEEKKQGNDVVDIVIDDESSEKASEDALKAETKPEDTVKTEAKKEDEAKAETKEEDEAKAETKEEDEAKTGTKAEDEVKAETNAEDEAKTETKAEDEVKAETNAEGEVKAETKTESEAKAETKAEDEKKADGVYVDEKAFKSHIRRHKFLKAMVITLSSLVLIGYLSMSIFSMLYFQPNTVINGMDCSYRTVDSVRKEFDQKKADYKLKIRLRDGEVVVNPSDIGLVITTKKDLETIKDNQNPFLWFIAIFKAPEEAAYEVSYDEAKMNAYLDSLDYFKTEKMKAPENPSVVLEDGKPVIKAGDPGTTIDREIFIKALSKKLYEMDTDLNLEYEGCYVKAKYDVDSPKIVDFLEQVEKYTSLKITYIYDKVKFTLTPEELYGMLDLNQENYTCEISRSKVHNFMGDFAWEHDTFERQRKFRTHDGKTVKLYSDKLGWQMDKDKEEASLYEALLHQRGFEREPEFLHRGNVYSADNADIGDSYVELDLTHQKVYFYMEGKLILQDDVISGNPNRGSNTPGGLYEIYGMRQNVVLTGPGYASHVDYWMPFNGEIGLHDAYWQSSFGGDLYLTRGSHGCVNLPDNTAKTIYEMGYRGLPVVAYWRTPEYMDGN